MIKRVVKTIIIDDENVNVGGVVNEGFSASSVQAVEPDGDVIDVVSGGTGESDNAYDAFVESADSESDPLVLDFSARDTSAMAGLGGFFLHTDSGEAYAKIGTSTYAKAANRYCKIVLSPDTETIDRYAFAQMIGLTEIEIDPAKPIKVGTGAFYCCPNLKTVGKLWDVITKINANSFSTRNGGDASANQFEYDKDIVAPALVAIGTTDLPSQYALNRCAFKSFSAPKLSYLGINTFANCARLEKVELNSVHTIPPYCFYNCQSLKELVFGRGVTLENTNALAGTPFETDPTNCVVKAPMDEMETFENDTNWAYYKQLGVTFEEIWYE